MQTGLRYSPVVTARFPVQLRDDGGPPYRQLLESVRRMIEGGSLLPGDRIPPVRTLAGQLDLAPNTVARAYRELEDGGWIEGRGRAGTFVADRLPQRPSEGEAAASFSSVRGLFRTTGRFGALTKKLAEIRRRLQV